MQALKNKARPALLLATGLASGLINGLLGAGGGIITVLAVSRLGRDRLSDSRDVYANALAVTLALTLTSTALYALRSNTPPADLTSLLLPAAAGGLAGGLLLGRISSGTLQLLFSVLLVVSGVLMILR